MEKEERNTAVLIGDGRMAQEVLHVLEEHPSMTVAAVVHHRNPAHGFRRVRAVDLERPEKLIECNKVNDPDVLERIESIAPDIMFNVNNFDLIGPRLMGLAADGIINFHNGPLPKYRGLNIPSWAIINGERRHAVSWHFIDSGVDTGPVVRESAFDLSDHETAITLIFRCIDEGIHSLPGVLDDYAAGTLTATPQEGEAHYFSAHDTPNDGRIDFSSDFADIDRLVRGLTFHPFSNTFVAAHIRTDAGRLLVGGARLVEIESQGRPDSPGRVVDVADGHVVAQCNDACVALEYVADDDGTIVNAQRLASEFGLRPGVQI